MKKLFIFIHLVFIAFCSSGVNICEPPEEIDFNNLPVLIADTSVIETIRYITLETNKNCLIHNIDKIIFANNQFYILDIFQKAIMVFDEKGNYINKLQKTGKGPGEYIGINDFDIDADKNIVVYDNMAQKMIKYSSGFSEYEEIPLKVRFEQFAAIKKGYILRNSYDQGIITSRISKFNPQNKAIEELLGSEYYKDDFNLTRFGRFHLLRSGTNIYFNARFTGEIFKIDSDGNMQLQYNINGPHPSAQFLNDFAKNSRLAYTQAKYIMDIRNIFETSSTLIMTVVKGFPYHLAISKNNNKKVLLQGLSEKNYFGNNSFIGVADEEFISIINSNIISKGDWKEKVNQSYLPQNEKQKLLNLKAEDNPILILLKFKLF